MAKFLDLTGLGSFWEKVKTWANGNFILTTQKGKPNGVASLDGTGKVPAAQLPSYVDDVLEGYLHTDGKFYKEDSHTTAYTGEAGKIYVDITAGKNKTYRWSGTTYAEISESLALCTTSSTAFPGDKGQTAYEHSQKKTGNPHGVTKTDVGLANVTNAKQIAGLASGTTANHVVVWGADGYVVKDSGFTIEKSVPANAVFTDTKYSKFSTSADGLVPKPTTQDAAKFLKGDGTWGTVESATAITTEEIEALFN